jgi:hypothetical protein
MPKGMSSLGLATRAISPLSICSSAAFFSSLVSFLQFFSLTQNAAINIMTCEG